MKETASQLRNRPATCRKYYIHPAVVESYLSEKMFRISRGKLVRTQLRGHEAAMLALLKEFHSPNLRAQSTPCAPQALQADFESPNMGAGKLMVNWSK